jgi:hypothetical protein
MTPRKNTRENEREVETEVKALPSLRESWQKFSHPTNQQYFRKFLLI